jgi:hypothetical protein
MDAFEKRLAAAITAVTHYIQTEKEALCMPPVKPVPRFSRQVNLWGLSGRQAIMQMGSMMQLKAFQRLR